ncbi:hypothetical protein [uncultured Piscinibacter sp.]|uniref:hypothetical protein n=1 Tax=uncultured Piscinibacter sp. TaxID=1131835 RepID=UPI0026386E23|nr:hypothetical protein [uncultured Piscinibacter sp.]
MKKFWRPQAMALLTVLAIGAIAAEQGTSQPLTAWERFKAYAHQEKGVAVQEGRKLIAATDRRIAEMKKQAQGANQEARKAIEADIRALELKRKEAQSQLDRLAKSSANAWDATKEGFANAYRDLHQAYDNAVSADSK